MAAQNRPDVLDRTRVHAGATIIPVAIDSEDLAQTVHTVALFPESVAGGVAAAQQLAVKLRAGGLNAYFDQRKFGRVHPEVVAEPYLVSRSWCGAGWLGLAQCRHESVAWQPCVPGWLGRAQRRIKSATSNKQHKAAVDAMVQAGQFLALPTASTADCAMASAPNSVTFRCCDVQADSTGDTVSSLPGSHPAGMITVAWYDYRPDQVTPQRRSAYVAAIEKFLPGEFGRTGHACP
jgi:hypothetical protein